MKERMQPSLWLSKLGGDKLTYVELEKISKDQSQCKYVMHFPQVNTLYFSSKTAYQHNNSYSRNEILLKTSKVICSEINNASFTNDPPFDELGNPVCNVPMEAMIFINHKGWMCSLDTKNLPSETNSHCFNIMKERSPSINKVVVIVHGYLGNFNLQWLHDMKDAIQSVEDTTAVIVSIQFELRLKAGY